MPVAEAPPGRMLNAADVARMFGVTRVTIDRWIGQGGFPRPLQPSGRKGRRYWPEKALLDYQRGEPAPE